MMAFPLSNIPASHKPAGATHSQPAAFPEALLIRPAPGLLKEGPARRLALRHHRFLPQDPGASAGRQDRLPASQPTDPPAVLGDVHAHWHLTACSPLCPASSPPGHQLGSLPSFLPSRLCSNVTLTARSSPTMLFKIAVNCLNPLPCFIFLHATCQVHLLLGCFFIPYSPHWIINYHAKRTGTCVWFCSQLTPSTCRTCSPKTCSPNESMKEQAGPSDTLASPSA